MPTKPPTFRPGGARPAAARNQAADERRGSASSRGYGWPWQKAKAGHLRNSPVCRYCELQGNPAVAANTVDHLYPHRWPIYAAVFWIKQWWVSTCPTCHSGFKQAIERRGSTALDALARQLGLPTFADWVRVGGAKSPGPPST